VILYGYKRTNKTRWRLSRLEKEAIKLLKELVEIKSISDTEDEREIGERIDKIGFLAEKLPKKWFKCSQPNYWLPLM